MDIVSKIIRGIILCDSAVKIVNEGDILSVAGLIFLDHISGKDVLISVTVLITAYIIAVLIHGIGVGGRHNNNADIRVGLFDQLNACFKVSGKLLDVGIIVITVQYW